MLTAADWNLVAADLNGMATYLGLFGVGSVATGTAPTSGTPQLLIQGSVFSYSQSTAGAEQTVDFPTPFPGGWITVLVQSQSYGVSASINGSDGTTSSFGVRAFNSSGGVTSASLAYIAFGF